MLLQGGAKQLRYWSGNEWIWVSIFFSSMDVLLIFVTIQHYISLYVWVHFHQLGLSLIDLPVLHYNLLSKSRWTGINDIKPYMYEMLIYILEHQMRLQRNTISKCSYIMDDHNYSLLLIGVQSDPYLTPNQLSVMTPCKQY